MPFAIKHVFTEEEMKNPIIAKYLDHRKNQMIYYKKKQKEKLQEKSERFFNDEMDEKEAKNFKITLRRKLFK